MESRLIDSAELVRTLGDELRSVGMVVVPRDNGLEVRLSTFETIRVRIIDSALHCEARFGALSRTRARWTFSILSAVLVPELFLRTGVTASTLSVAFLMVLAAVSQAIRYTVTESIVSRIQMIWLNVRGVPSTIGVDASSLKAGSFTPDAALRGPAYSDESRARSEARPASARNTR